jgi:hypothetical protein
LHEPSPAGPRDPMMSYSRRPTESYPLPPAWQVARARKPSLSPGDAAHEIGASKRINALVCHLREREDPAGHGRPPVGPSPARTPPYRRGRVVVWSPAFAGTASSPDPVVSLPGPERGARNARLGGSPPRSSRKRGRGPGAPRRLFRGSRGLRRGESPAPPRESGEGKTASPPPAETQRVPARFPGAE